MGNITRNDNQRALMAEIFARFEAGTPATVGELRKKFAPNVTPPAFSCRLRFLLNKGMIARHSPRPNVFEIHPTQLGYAWFRKL